MGILVARNGNGRRRVARRGGVLAAAALLAVTALSALQSAHGVPPATTPPFNECPAVGSDTGCALLIIIHPGGTLSVVGDPNLGPFDGSDDSLIGVLNQSGQTVNSIALVTNTDAFGFEDDGLCSFTFTGSGGCPFGPTGYEGPNTSFSNISPDFTGGTVNFTGGLTANNSTYFSLEEALTPASFSPDDKPATGPCTTTYSGTVTNAVIVKKNSTTCIDNANVVSGATISVPAGAELVVTNSTLAGSITATKPHAMTICGSTIGGSVYVSGSTAFVLIGDGEDGSISSPCTGNTIKGSVTLTKATGGVELGGDMITGSVTVTYNVAPTGGSPTEDAATEIEGNSIGGSLTCLKNNPAPDFDGAPSTVGGARIGQCRLVS